ncbi:MAG: hypothetical protein ACTS4V_01640 [Candidatus Hodgkinia cicadicola]
MLHFILPQTHDGKTYSIASINLSLTSLRLVFPSSVKLGFDYINSICSAQFTSTYSVNIASCSFRQLLNWAVWLSRLTFIESSMGKRDLLSQTK